MNLYSRHRSVCNHNYRQSIILILLLKQLHSASPDGKIDTLYTCRELKIFTYSRLPLDRLLRD